MNLLQQDSDKRSLDTYNRSPHDSRRQITDVANNARSDEDDHLEQLVTAQHKNNQLVVGRSST